MTQRIKRKLSLPKQIEQEQQRLKEWRARNAVSICRRYQHQFQTGDSVLQGYVRVADGQPVRAFSWSNRSTGQRTAYKVEFSDGEQAEFSRPKHPHWLVRRWVECFGPPLKTICHRLRREGVKIVNAYKPDMCVWNTLHLRGDRTTIDQVLTATGQEWTNRCPPGGWD